MKEPINKPNCRVCLALHLLGLSAFCEQHGDYQCGVRGIVDGKPFGPGRGGAGGGESGTLWIECDQVVFGKPIEAGSGQAGGSVVIQTRTLDTSLDTIKPDSYAECRRWRLPDGQTIEFAEVNPVQFGGRGRTVEDDFLD